MSFLKKSSFAVCAAIGTAAALVLTALMLLPVAWAVSAEALSLEAGGICAWPAAGLAVLIPTAVIARARGGGALPIGGVIAGGCVLLAALMCAGGGDGCAFGTWLAYLAAAVLAGALAGALLSVRQNRHKKRRR